MYYAEYDTGIFKCCTTVYSPPTRSYAFDTLFVNPANLHPGTPMFQDVVNLSYHQNFTPQYPDPRPRCVSRYRGFFLFVHGLQSAAPSDLNQPRNGFARHSAD